MSLCSILPSLLVTVFIFLFITCFLFVRLNDIRGSYYTISNEGLIGFIILCSLSLYSYFSVSFSDPGVWAERPSPSSNSSVSPPPLHSLLSSLAPSLLRSPFDPSNASELFPCVESKWNGLRRFCRKTAFYKPDRSHYCYSCKSTILKMDHVTTHTSILYYSNS
jgi:hypothetical protein